MTSTTDQPNPQRPRVPLFSIITVTYNAAGVLPRTLDSVAAQTCRLFEFIVIDGASTDHTVQVVNESCIPETALYSEPDNGIYDAMNKGLGQAVGEYVIFLNAGDTFHAPDTLQRLADAIFDNDFPGIVYGQTDIVDNSGRRLGSRHLTAPEKLTLESFSDGMVVCHQAFCALRAITGPFDCRYSLSADYDWCIRCLQHSRRNVYMGEEPLVDYLSEGVSTRRRRQSLMERFRIMSYYYGMLPTLARHLRFLPRYLRQRRRERAYDKV